MTSTRLNKFIAHSAGLSRREADEAIAAGRVQVNDAIALLGTQVKPTDVVVLDGTKITAQRQYTYLLLNKPIGYVCSRRAQGDTSTIYSLLPDKYHALKTVGRLDRDSSGLIILTDDGDFAHRMTHPRFAKTKVYHVELDHALEPLHQQMISDFGVTLDDGISRFSVMKLDDGQSTIDARKSQKNSVAIPNVQRPTSNAYCVTMSEGRNRQIRRTFAALGYTVTRLHRTTFGPYSLTTEAFGESHSIDL